MAPLRRIVLLGQTARASASFSLSDLPGTTGRLDALLRALRASLLTSHGIRHDVIVYLVLLGLPDHPATLRIEGRTVRFIRPDERVLGSLVQKALEALARSHHSLAFVPMRDGITVCARGLDAVLDDLDAADRPTTLYVLDEGAPDIRTEAFAPGADVAFFVGDHLGLRDDLRAILAARGARSLGLGPVSVHVEDAVVLTHNELDRRGAAGAPA